MIKPIVRPLDLCERDIRAIIDGRKTQVRRRYFPCPPYLEFTGWIKNWVGICYPGSPAWQHAERRRGPGRYRSVPAEAYGFARILPSGFHAADGRPAYCPFGRPGDRLYVRERWVYGCGLAEAEPGSICAKPGGKPAPKYLHQASDEYVVPAGVQWRPSRSMPMEAARLALEIERVRLQRVHDVSEADIRAEGFSTTATHYPLTEAPSVWRGTDAQLHLLCQWRDFWTERYGRHSWRANPWVWALDVRLIDVALVKRAA